MSSASSSKEKTPVPWELGSYSMMARAAAAAAVYLSSRRGAG